MESTSEKDTITPPAPTKEQKPAVGSGEKLKSPHQEVTKVISQKAMPSAHAPENAKKAQAANMDISIVGEISITSGRGSRRIPVRFDLPMALDPAFVNEVPEQFETTFELLVKKPIMIALNQYLENQDFMSHKIETKSSSTVDGKINQSPPAFYAAPVSILAETVKQPKQKTG